MISHRLANVVGSDNIYVMEKGSITEQGSHNTLLAQNGVYKNYGILNNVLKIMERRGKCMKQRSGFTVMLQLIGLVKPLTGFMILAILWD